MHSTPTNNHTTRCIATVSFPIIGKLQFNKLDETNYVGVDNLLQNRVGKTKSNHVPTEGNLTGYFVNDILIGNIRPYLKKIWHADREGGTNGDVLVIHPTDETVIPRYLYQVLADDKFFDYNMQHAKGARRAILPHETLGTPVAKYSFTYGANWISPSTPCVRFNFAQKPLR